MADVISCLRTVFVTIVAGLQFVQTTRSELPPRPEIEVTDSPALTLSTSSDNTAAIVLAVTFPCALVVGLLWCYCMSWCLGLTKRQQKFAHLREDFSPPLHLRCAPPPSEDSSSSLSEDELEIDVEMGPRYGRP